MPGASKWRPVARTAAPESGVGRPDVRANATKIRSVDFGNRSRGSFRYSGSFVQREGDEDRSPVSTGLKRERASDCDDSFPHPA